MRQREVNVTEISDDYMRQMGAKTREYSCVILKRTPRLEEPGADKIVWEHGRRNYALRAEGLLSIVCPIRDGSPLAGIAIFDADAEATRRIMEEDPGVKAGVLSYEVHTCRSFPGDQLPK